MRDKLLFAVWAAVILTLFAGCNSRKKYENSIAQARQAEEDEDYKQAIADYTEAIRLNSKSAEAYLHRGSDLIISGEFGQAIDDLNTSIQLDPNEALAYEMRGYASFGLQKYDEAITNYNQALRLAPDDGDIFAARGKAWYWIHNYTNAIVDLTKALEFSTNDAEIYDDRGGAYWAANKIDKAFDDFQSAVRVKPNDIIALYNRSRIYSTEHSYTNAIHDLEKVISLRPKAVGAYNLLAWQLATCPQDELRDGKRAVELATKACDLSRWKKYAYVDTLAAAYAETGDFENAVKYQKQAASMDGIPEYGHTNVQYRLELYQQQKPYRNWNDPHGY